MIAVMSHDLARLLEPLCPQPVNFPAGTSVFRLEDKVRRIYVVRTGLVHLLRHQQNGAPLVLQRAGPDSVLAEASVFSDAYHCDAIAVVETDALCVPRDALRDRIGSDGAFALEWTMRLGHEVQKARHQAEIMSIRTVAGRLDAWLALRNEVPERGEWVGLAARIGVSPEALYREIAKRRL